MERVTSLVHIHIPRAAGSSLHAHLYGPMHSAGIDLISEHCFWGDYPPAEGRLFFVVLRHPIDRILSLASYILATPQHAKRAHLEAVGLEAYLRDKSSRTDQMTNGQVRMLAGRDTIGSEVGLKDYMAAAAVLRRPDVVVAFADDLPAGIAVLSERLGVDILDEAPRRNAAEPREWSGEARWLISVTNRWDGDLYRYAQSLAQSGDRKVG